ncbi:DNA ligase [candidate division KSB1 bacterium]|nr:DNA ligase [candidate division KSB1 bacterium]
MSGGSKEFLKEYRTKRDFDRTREPFGAESGRGQTPEPIFVIQKHDASNLHYDFRLEIDGLLKSWAIPKGPSLNPKEKRLAIPTEDHPLEYAQFEGVIPEDEYGGGTVMIWDAGTINPVKEDHSLAEEYKEGHIEVWLKGNKLEGGYALIRTGKGKDAKWLLIKMDDDKADARRNPVNSEPKSVKSGRTLKEIKKKESS